jgi:hypothetical protein
MLGSLSKIGVVAATIMIPTALSAQMGGTVNPGAHIGGAVSPGATVRGAVERGIPGPDLGLGAHRVKKFTVPASVVRPPPQSSTDKRYGQPSFLIRSWSVTEGRHRVEAARLALCLRPLATLG